jgi:hypothetical protein
MEEGQMMDEQLKSVYDYTKFHIGLYTTLITAVIAFRKFVLGAEPTATRFE